VAEVGAAVVRIDLNAVPEFVDGRGVVVHGSGSVVSWTKTKESLSGYRSQRQGFIFVPKGES
jgi:hypothetical protein